MKTQIPQWLASLLLILVLAATILPPGYPAYVGAYIAMGAALVLPLACAWRERAVVRHPTAFAVLTAIVLVAVAVPFVYKGERDLLAPVLMLPMLSTIALGMAGRDVKYMPGPIVFASLCLAGVTIALVGALYEHLVLGIYRPGLGNNPIHYGSLAAMSGGLALVGVVAGASRWRYVFLLGPAFGVATAVISDSRGPMIGALAIAAVGTLLLLAWLWREREFRFAVLAVIGLATVGALTLTSGVNIRVTGVLQNGLNIFLFTGGPDDIRAALYSSALEILRMSPIYGVGLGQIMETVQRLYPEQGEAFTLENLHADWANFAAMAGGLGIIAWLLLLSAPLFLLIDTNIRRDRPIVLGAVLLFIGQLTLGVSNTTFGILPQTATYAVMLGYLLARARRLTQVSRPF